MNSDTVFTILFWSAQFLAITNITLVIVWASVFLGGFAWQDDPLHEFNYHPVLAVIGLIVFHGEGLLIYRAMRFKPKLVLKAVHATIFGISFILTVISMKTVFDSHNYRQIPISNMYSLHSWIGLGAVILSAVQFCTGVIAFVCPGVQNIYRRKYLPLHRFFGFMIFILSVISCNSGITEKIKGSLGHEYQHLPSAAFVANFLGVSITMFAMTVLYLVVMPEYKRRPLPEEDNVHVEMSGGYGQF